MTHFDKARYQVEKMARRATKTYPLATIAYYGPDDTRASKVVVGIITKAESSPDALEKLYAANDTEDVRMSHAINTRILEIVEERGVQSVVMADRILGCPHEEGIDYPLGEACPKCPFWANRNRFTGDVIQ